MRNIVLSTVLTASLFLTACVKDIEKAPTTPVVTTAAACGVTGKFSKPAHGNVDEIDPKAAPSHRLDNLLNVNDHGDQCRAVLGEIPKIDCTKAALIPTRVNGQYVTYANKEMKLDGVATKWTPRDGCDHPGLLSWLFAPIGANPVEGCFPNARLGVKKIGHVNWTYVCHSGDGPYEPTDKFDFVTLIGSNELTGESCYFGHDFLGRPHLRDRGENIIPPGGTAKHDLHGRSTAHQFWTSPTPFGCIECHGANKPLLVTPHTNQKRVVGDGTMEVLAEVPYAKRLTPQWGFRVVGTAQNLQIPRRPKAIYPKYDDGSEDHTCTQCHMLTNQENFLRLARMAVGLGELHAYAEKTKNVVSDRTPWMPPGNDGSDAAKKKYGDAVLRYQRAFFDEKWRARPAVELLTPCPKPEPLVASAVKREGTKLTWTYKNAYGEVPTRDDVRFHLSVGDGCEVRDVAPEALGSDQWSVTVPAGAKILLTPYRYCFDETGYAHAPTVEVK